MDKIKILLCGGGTGGHVLPLVEVARSIRKLSPETKIYFVGPEEFSLDPLREGGIIIKKIIAAGKIRRYFSWWNFIEPLKVPLALVQSFYLILFINPDVVLGKGSYGSIWPILAAWILRKKIILHESDAIPGLANRFLSKFTPNIALAFEETKKFFPHKKTYTVGNPVRLKYLGLTKPEAKEILGPEKTDHVTSIRSYARATIFISGGSQGAQRINNIILRIIDNLLRDYAVIWSVGSNNYADVKHRVSNASDLKIVPLLSEKELASAYILCDLAIGRAGAGTIFELAAFEKPSILIPLERNGGDQPFNARAYAGTGAAVVLKESDLTAPKLLDMLDKILSDSNLLATMSQKAKEFAKIEAGDNLAVILLNLATSNK
ncbi:MAG: UDP-N-acetylglucosamine--N-acetylmuramyl-(pentapeptide) pyrophosphoryl-undecaprenol N-acetylglucosamine transferase [Patescibacteria group bacterium]